MYFWKLPYFLEKLQAALKNPNFYNLDIKKLQWAGILKNNKIIQVPAEFSRAITGIVSK